MSGLVESNLTLYNTKPSWAYNAVDPRTHQIDFFANDPGWYSSLIDRYGLNNYDHSNYSDYGWQTYYCDDYRPVRRNRRKPRPQPTPNPNPTPDPSPNPPTPGPNPTPNPPNPPTPGPNPNPNPNQINATGTRQANGQPNVFTFDDNPGVAKTFNAAPSSGAIFNNLFNDVNANLDGAFTGYIGGRETTLRRSAQPGGTVNAIVHSFGTFGDPTDNSRGTAPISIDLGSRSTDIPHRLIVVAGEGDINMRGGDLALMSSRSGGGRNNGFTIRDARSVKIAGESLDLIGQDGQFNIFRDERNQVYRINNSAQVSRDGRDRANFEDTRSDVPGQSGPNFIVQGGQLPHPTEVNVAGQPSIQLPELFPFRRDQAPPAAQQNQPTPRAGMPTATGFGARPLIA
jgi:hypothetical protein